MKKSPDELIELYGIANSFPVYSKNLKEFQLQELLLLSNKNFEIKTILSCICSVKIDNYYTIEVSQATSHNGEKSTGKDLIIYGTVSTRFEYISKNGFNSIHHTDFHINFSTYMVLEETFNFNSNFIVNSYIEDIYISKISGRKIFINLLLLLNTKEFDCIKNSKCKGCD